MKLIKVTDKLYLDPRYIVSVTVKEQWKNSKLESYITLTTAVASHTVLTANVGDVEALICDINKAVQED